MLDIGKTDIGFLTNEFANAVDSRNGNRREQRREKRHFTGVIR